MVKWKNVAKKVATVGVIGVVGFGLTGCTEDPVTIDNVPASVKQQIESNVDITSDNAGVIDKAIEDFKTAELEKEDIKDDVVPVEEVITMDMLWSDDFYLGNSISLTLGDSKIVKLIDDVVDVDGNNYDVAEYLVFTGDAKVVGSEDYKEFEDKPYLIFEKKGALRYEYKFEDPIPVDDIEKDGLDIKFLGKNMKITKVEGDKMIIQSGTEFYFNVEDSKGGVTLENVGLNGAVVVSVNGVREMIKAYDKKTIEGIEIENVETFYAEGVEERSATLIVGDDVEKEIDDDEFYGDSELFKYEIKVSNDELEKISLVLDEKFYDLDKDNKPIAIGESISLPEGYLTISFKGTNEPDYVGYNFDKDGNCIEISSNDEEGFVVGTEEYKKVYYDSLLKVFYDDDCGEDLLGNSLDLDDSSLVLNKNLKIKNGNDILLDINNLPQRDESLLTSFGILVENPEEWNEDGELSIEIPKEQIEVTLEAK